MNWHTLTHSRALTSATIAVKNVDQALVNVTCDLEIIRGLHELHASESARRDDASTTTRPCTPRDEFPLSICNGRVRFRGTPNAEIYIRTQLDWERWSG